MTTIPSTIPARACELVNWDERGWLHARNERVEECERGGSEMDSATYEEHLARVPLFRDLAPRELTWLSAGCREREYEVGATLARAGHAGGGLLILLRGRAVRTLPQPGGSEQPTGQLAPGAVIGEMSLYSEVPHQETVTALEPCLVLALPRWDFQASLRETPDIAIRLLGVLSARMLAAEQRTGKDPDQQATANTPQEAN